MPVPDSWQFPELPAPPLPHLITAAESTWLTKHTPSLTTQKASAGAAETLPP